MKPNSRLTMYLLISGFFLLLDQALKYLARTNSDFSFYLWKNWFGWEYNYRANKIGSIPNFGATATSTPGGPGPSGSFSMGDTASVSGGAIPKGSVAQWLHGNPNRAGYDEGHAGQANAHDYFSFKSRAAAIAAYGKLKSSGYKPYEFEGYDKVGKHSPIGGHYGMVGGKPTYTDKTDGTAFDIPWATYGSGPIGKGDYDKSLKAAQIVGALALGGRIHKPIIALIGERGPEFVFDADTTRGLDKLAPQLLEKLNFASTKPQLASILQSYAPYDASASSQTIVIQSSSAPSGGRNNNSSGGGVAVIPIPVDNFTEILAMIG